jgi:four helix bundle protein
MELVTEIYTVTRLFPKEETYGLVSQLRRAAISVPSNIAEGACDRSSDQFRNFLAISIGSLNEMDTQLELAHRIGYLDDEKYNEVQALVDECLAITYGLRRSISR